MQVGESDNAEFWGNGTWAKKKKRHSKMETLTTKKIGGSNVYSTKRKTAETQEGTNSENNS